MVADQATYLEWENGEVLTLQLCSFISSAISALGTSWLVLSYLRHKTYFRPIYLFFKTIGYYLCCWLCTVNQGRKRRQRTGTIPQSPPPLPQHSNSLAHSSEDEDDEDDEDEDEEETRAINVPSKQNADSMRFNEQTASITKRFSKLVFLLAVVDLINSVVWIVAGIFKDSSDWVCEITGPIKLYLYVSSFFWTCIIATETLYRFSNVTFSQLGEANLPLQSNVGMWLYYVIAFIIPLGLIVEPLINRNMKAGSWSCWFDDIEHPLNYAFMGIIIVTMVYCGLCYSFVTSRYKRALKKSGHYSQADRQRAIHLQRRVSLYMLAYVGTWLAPLVTNLLEVAGVPKDNYHVIFSLTVLSAITMPLTGGLNSVVYGWNRYMIRRVYKVFLYVMCCGCFRSNYRKLQQVRERERTNASQIYPGVGSDDDSNRFLHEDFAK